MTSFRRSCPSTGSPPTDSPPIRAARQPCRLFLGKASRVASGALDWLFPPACALCGAPGPALCSPCTSDATLEPEAACRRCAVPLHATSIGRLCGRCLRRAPAFDRTIAGAVYAPPFDQLVRAFKYGAALAHAPLFAALIDRQIEAAGDDNPIPIDVVVPVPLSRERMAARGFNQAIEIGRFVARRLDVPMQADAALRIHDTRAQASLPFDARRRNVRDAFAVADRMRSALVGRDVGVVDDVMTTGATLDALARALKGAGAKTVTGLVVARTP